MKFKILILISFIILPAIVFAQNVNIYVNQQASGANSGKSWEYAYTDLQTALKNAKSGQQIWVAAGIYHPTTDADRSVFFEMVEEVALYGGFQGDEQSLSERDWKKNLTVLSGDIGQQGVIEDNTKQVVKGADYAVIDGFIIENGYCHIEGLNILLAPLFDIIPVHLKSKIIPDYLLPRIKDVQELSSTGD